MEREDLYLTWHISTTCSFITLLFHISYFLMSNGPSSQPPLESATRSPLQAPAHSFIDRNHISGYMIQQRSSRKSIRPATAPAVSREDQVLLPSKPLTHRYNPWPSSSTSSPESDQDNASNPSCKQTGSLHSLKTVPEEEIDISGPLQLGVWALSTT